MHKNLLFLIIGLALLAGIFFVLNIPVLVPNVEMVVYYDCAEASAEIVLTDKSISYQGKTCVVEKKLQIEDAITNAIGKGSTKIVFNKECDNLEKNISPSGNVADPNAQGLYQNKNGQVFWCNGLYGT